MSLTAAWGFAVYGPYTYLGAALHQDAHFGPRLIAVALAIYGAGAILGDLLGGPLADRAGPRATTTASLLVLAAVEAGLGAITQQRFLLLIGLAAFALSAYPFFTAQQTRLINAFPAASATLLAWNNTALYAGILAGSAAGGAILGAAGFPALLGTAAGISLLGAAISPGRSAPRCHNGRHPSPGSLRPQAGATVVVIMILNVKHHDVPSEACERPSTSTTMWPPPSNGCVVTARSG